jgi:hypothetical protein
MKGFKIAVLLLAALSSLRGAAALQTDAARRPRSPWDTCIYVEGKGDYCGAGEKPRKFEEYLLPDWLKQPVDGFSVNTGLDRLQPGKDTFRASWSEVGVLASSRIRFVEYSVNDRPSGAFEILAGRNDGLYAPLMKWNGIKPEIKVYRSGPAGVIGFSRDFGGNVPMVTTWAWISTNSGPVQLELDQAIRDAIDKISPVFNCYSTEFDWSKLYLRTWCWPGEWPSKPGVKDGIEAWFDFKDGKLVPNRVELRNFEDPESVRRWP